MRMSKLIVLPVVAAIILSMNNCFATAMTSGKNGKVEWRQLRKIQLPYNPIDIAHTLDGKLSFILTDNGRVLIYDARGILQGSIPVDEGVSAIDTDSQGNYIYLVDSSQKITSTIAVDFVVDISSTDAPFKGDVNAPVTIAVFSDFQ